MVIFSERGGRGGIAETGDRNGMNHYIMGSAQTNPSSKSLSPSVFDFVIHAQRGTLNAKSDDDGPVLPPLKLPSHQIGSDEVTISPPRSHFFQFGKGDGSRSSLERKYGSVRETYTYSFDHDDLLLCLMVEEASQIFWHCHNIYHNWHCGLQLNATFGQDGLLLFRVVIGLPKALIS